MKCPALGCNSHQRVHKSLMWHRFPLRRPFLLARWTAKLTPNINLKYRRLCAIHFHKNCYVRTKDEQKPLKLGRNAYPTLFEGQQIDDNYLLDESLANVGEKSAPPTTVRKRDVAGYKKKKKEQRQCQSGDNVVDSDRNFTFIKDDEDEAEYNNDNNLLLLASGKQYQSPHTVEFTYAATHYHQNNNDGNQTPTHALLSTAQLQHTQKNMFEDVRVWAEQFMADTLVTEQHHQQQLESTTLNKQTNQTATSTKLAITGARVGAGKRKLPASSAQQKQMPTMRPSKTSALHNKMLLTADNTSNEERVIHSATPSKQLEQQFHSVLLNYNNSISNFNLTPNLHVLASDLASLVAQNSHFNSNNGSSVVMGNKRRKLNRLAREMQSLRRQLSLKDNELQEMRNSIGGDNSSKQPAFALIPLGTNSVSLAALARFLQTLECSDGSVAGVGQHNVYNNGDNADRSVHQFEIREMRTSGN